jgi:hypothetical protein
MEAALGIVDGQAYVWGAVANDVMKVTITTTSGEIDATLGTNGFVAPVSQAEAQCPITVTATAPAGKTTTTLKPVPAVAAGKNSVPPGHATNATC